MRVEHYEFGRIIVNGKTFTSDIVVGERVVNPNWWRKEGHRIQVDDIADILEYEPEVVVFGTGYHGLVKIDADVVEILRKKGIASEKLRSRDAVERFNELIKDGKNAVLAIHLTC
jgi:hypothetical protein